MIRYEIRRKSPTQEGEDPVLDYKHLPGQEIWQGTLTSNTVLREIVRKNEQADYPASGLASKAKSIAEYFMAKQYFKNSYEAKASPIQEFADYVDCYFKRKIPIEVKGDGLVRVNKRTWKAEWIGSI